MTERRKILVTASYYLPGYRAGGPIRSVLNLVRALQDTYDFSIVTRNRDLGQKEPYREINANNWTKTDGVSVYYGDREALSFGGLRKLLNNERYDAIYLNSFFDPSLSIQPLILRRLGLIRDCPIILAPRGEFARAALSLKSIKKHVYLVTARIVGLCGSIIWHASTPLEEQDIRRAVGSHARVVVVQPDAVGVPKARTRHIERAQGEPLRIVFLSRISRMKNLHFAIDVLSEVKSAVTFDVIGPLEDEEYWRECQAKAAELPDNVKLRSLGAVPPAEVQSILSKYDLFFLPTLGENFGHAIVEALQFGLPALISDRTPWRNLTDQRAGADLPLEDKRAFAKFIDDMAILSIDQLHEMRECARNFVEARMAEFSRDKSKNLFSFLDGAPVGD